MDNIINYIPEKWRGTVLLLVALSPYLSRAYYAVIKGGGIRGALSAIWLGTNTPPLSRSIKSDTELIRKLQAAASQPDPSSSTKLNVPIKMLIVIAGAFLAVILCGGCTTALTSNKIVTMKQRCFGLVVETASTANSTPNVKLGFTSTVIELIPTSTNSPIYAPKYADTFDMQQSINPFATAISENTGTGNVEIGTNGQSSAVFWPLQSGTNSVNK